MDQICCKEITRPTDNLRTFSAYIGEIFHSDPDILYNYLMGTISVALALDKAAHAYIDTLYNEDYLTYYRIAGESACIHHYTLLQGNPETEIFARKVLGILLAAECNPPLRKRLIALMQQFFTPIYKTVKKHDFKYLREKHVSTSAFLSSPEAKYDRSVYFYLSLYCSPDWVDQDTIRMIVHSIYQHEMHSPMQADIGSEIRTSSKLISRLRDSLEQNYGKLDNYLDILQHSDPVIHNFGNVIENLFLINRLNIDDIYYNHRQLSMNHIYLSIAKLSDFNPASKYHVSALLACIFLQPLLTEYQYAKQIIAERSREKTELQQKIYEKKITELKKENELLYAKAEALDTENRQLTLQLSQVGTRLHKEHDKELAGLNRTICSLRLELKKEAAYRQELNKLREFIFNLDVPVIEPVNSTIPLNDQISEKNIVIIGGPRHWRQKLRINFPKINTLNGSNASIDLSLFKKLDCVLFYTGYMSHAVYNKAMNYIRANQIKFAYIKTTNIQLLEAELTELLKQCEII